MVNMRNVRVSVKEKSGISYDLNFDLKDNYPKEEVLKFKDKFVEVVKKQYPNAEVIRLMIPTKSKIAKDKLMRIGQEVASGWGAICVGIKTYEDEVEFTCNEFGEVFTTTLTYEEIKEEYAYVD